MNFAKKKISGFWGFFWFSFCVGHCQKAMLDPVKTIPSHTPGAFPAVLAFPGWGFLLPTGFLPNFLDGECQGVTSHWAPSPHAQPDGHHSSDQLQPLHPETTWKCLICFSFFPFLISPHFLKCFPCFLMPLGLTSLLSTTNRARILLVSSPWHA